MKKDKIYTERLLQLAFHLDKGEDFYSIWAYNLLKIKTNNKKSLLILVGPLNELADLFADDFKFGPEGVVPVPREMTMYNQLIDFFGITHEELKHIFCPRMQSIDRFGGHSLYIDSSPQDISDNIFEMLKKEGWFNPYKK